MSKIKIIDFSISACDCQNVSNDVSTEGEKAELSHKT